MSRIAVVLHNIRSAHNVGSIFRTADGAGASLVVLCGYTPQPKDTFDRPQKDIAKTALGAEKTVPWRYAKTLSTAVHSLKKEGYVVVGVEQDAASIVHTKLLPIVQDVAFVMGNEVKGLSASAKKLCDKLVEIPMHGKKESLNVSVAAGIILFAATQ